METPHIPVLLDEVLESFKGVGEGYFVDCTLGYAGSIRHWRAVLPVGDGYRSGGIPPGHQPIRPAQC